MPTATSTPFPASPRPASPTEVGLTHPPPTLPPASTFDLLPEALQALTTLLASSNFPIAAASSDSANGHAANGAANGTESIPPAAKDLPELMVAAKRKIQSARDAVRGLPDIERSIEQQEVEMRRVEARIERLRGVWAEVRAAAASAAETAAGAAKSIEEGQVKQNGEAMEGVKLEQGQGETEAEPQEIKRETDTDDAEKTAAGTSGGDKSNAEKEDVQMDT